ncbi:MAG: hypothetical protein CMJ32_10125 [Phycisphaerae bacterium]|nr:hypothetical protein [Phycisphaerae bacterium]
MVMSISCFLSVTDNATGDSSNDTWPPTPTLVHVEVEGRPPLLREGGFIVQAEGTVRQVLPGGYWVFVPDNSPSNQPAMEIIILPSAPLQDIVNAMQSPDPPERFEMTGQVLRSEDRNFLLPSLAPPIREFQPQVQIDEVETVEVETSTEFEDDPFADASIDIEQRLEQRIQSVPTSTDRGDPTRPLMSNTSRSDLPSRIVSRRGHIIRDPDSGTWRFVFETRGFTSHEPDLELLPSSFVMPLVKMVRQWDQPRAVLVSGQVTFFQERGYLLLDSYTIPKAGVGLGP